MTVVEINGYHVRFAPMVPLGNARTIIRNREFLLVRLKTAAGLVGWGEVFSSPWAAAALIRRQFAMHVIGQSPQQHGRIYHDMTATLGYDRRGPAMMAISALDMALHDLAARERGLTVAEHLGGAIQSRIPAYASGPFMREGPQPYAHYEAEATHYLEQGFRALKPRAGASPAADGSMAHGLRRAVGPGVDLMVDVNQGYASGAACQSARAMQDASLLWVEEPVQPEDVAGYRAVASASTIPVAGGEALGSLAAFREFLEAGALSILQPDLTVCGGFTGFQRVSHLAGAYSVPVLPHMFGTAINFYASLQMAALTSPRRGGGHAAFPYIEYDSTGNPLLELFGFPIGADGCVSLPDGPGIGIELDPARLEPWAVETWSVGA